MASQTTIAELHAIMQTVFGWSGEHLHWFDIHGTEYGMYAVGGSWFRDDARTVRLQVLGFGHESGSGTSTTFTPAGTSISGSSNPPRRTRKAVRALHRGPPGRPVRRLGRTWEFQQRTQPHLVFGALLRAAKIMGQLLDADTDDQLANILGADRDELAELLPLLGLELFDRKACNQALATCAAGAVEGRSRR